MLLRQSTTISEVEDIVSTGVEGVCGSSPSFVERARNIAGEFSII